MSRAGKEGQQLDNTRGLHPPEAAFDQHHTLVPQGDILGVERVRETERIPLVERAPMALEIAAATDPTESVVAMFASVHQN
jgi:hypothetical protein